MMQFPLWLEFLVAAGTIVVYSVDAEDIGDSGQLQPDVEVIPDNQAACEEDPVDRPPSDIEDEPPSAEYAGDAPPSEDDGGDAGGRWRRRGT
ncbi:hypothetical protein AAVH_29851 [Aphelenchoides avenae]|nr:hypothetical protein AAVH_29851 [Aphelenchus avenae]